VHKSAPTASRTPSSRPYSIAGPTTVIKVRSKSQQDNRSDHACRGDQPVRMSQATAATREPGLQGMSALRVVETASPMTPESNPAISGTNATSAAMG
jgi:hypothetical protein